jgi:hypothetical protein
LSFSLVGGVVACFGIGGLIYAALVKLLVYRLGQVWLALTGGIILAIAYLQLAVGPVWWLAPIATTAIGLGFYMLHNADQCHADDAAGARHRRGFVLVGALRRADRRRRGGRGRYRSRRRPAIVFGHRDRAAGTRNLVCAEIETIPAGGLTARRKNLFTL